MTNLWSAKMLAVLSPFLSSASETAVTAPITFAKNEAIVYEGKTMKIIVPDHPLAKGSLKIIPRSPETELFTDWQENHHQETQDLLNRISKVWEKKGITQYLIFGKEYSQSQLSFTWEIIPYENEGFTFWKQFKVLWNVTFGGPEITKNEQEKIVKDFQNELFSEKQTKQIEIINRIALSNDAFCKPNVIERQRVFEGKEINVLYNYAPIVLGKDKLHFLIIPKEHRSAFANLTESEYVEAMQLSQKLINYYKDKGYPTAYLYDKTGPIAGQTVLHFHEHIVFAATKTQELLGKLAVLKNMTIGSSPLSDNELKARVDFIKDELKEALK